MEGELMDTPQWGEPYGTNGGRLLTWRDPERPEAPPVYLTIHVSDAGVDLSLYREKPVQSRDDTKWFSNVYVDYWDNRIDLVYYDEGESEHPDEPTAVQRIVDHVWPEDPQEE
jgi:hypothetical protein